jgi:hypothetical protein
MNCAAFSAVSSGFTARNADLKLACRRLDPIRRSRVVREDDRAKRTLR